MASIQNMTSDDEQPSVFERKWSSKTLGHDQSADELKRGKKLPEIIKRQLKRKATFKADFFFFLTQSENLDVFSIKT